LTTNLALRRRPTFNSLGKHQEKWSSSFPSISFRYFWCNTGLMSCSVGT